MATAFTATPSPNRQAWKRMEEDMRMMEKLWGHRFHTHPLPLPSTYLKLVLGYLHPGLLYTGQMCPGHWCPWRFTAIFMCPSDLSPGHLPLKIQLLIN